MKKIPTSFPDGTFPRDVLDIVKQLRDKGYTSYLVGGCVRDLLMKRTPKDFDIVSDAPPDDVEKIFPSTEPVGKSFGVILVIKNRTPYEVSTFRKDGKYIDGRHPESVSFGDVETDARRRDFTINALYLDTFNNLVLDYVDGIEDIKQKKIRTVGIPRERIREDYLRMLRAVRFTSSLGFNMEQELLTAIIENVQGINTISKERIKAEIEKILISPNPDKGFRLLDRTGLLEIILPEIKNMQGVKQPENFHPEGDVFEHTILLLKNLPENPSPALAWGALLHDVGKPPTFTVKDRIRFNEHTAVGARMARDILTRLPASNDLIEKVVYVTRDHQKFIDVKKMRKSTLRRFLGDENFRLLLEVHRIDCLSCHQDLSEYEFCIKALESYKNEPVKPPPLVKGRHLIEIGYTPGPIFREILDKVYDLQLEGKIETPEEGLEMVKKDFPL